MSVLDKPANFVVPILLFIVLTPGLFVTLPDNKQPLYVQTLTHAAVFGVTYALLRNVFAKYY